MCHIVNSYLHGVSVGLQDFILEKKSYNPSLSALHLLTKLLKASCAEEQRAMKVMETVCLYLKRFPSVF